MKIELYLDQSDTPFKTIVPPEKISFNTEGLDDGEHTMLLKTIENDGRVLGTKTIRFSVQNGPTVAVHGLKEHQTVSGEFDVLINAYGSRVGDEFEIERIETPAPAPTWAWVLMLVVFAGAVGYLTSSLNDRHLYDSPIAATSTAPVAETNVDGGDAQSNATSNLGVTVYGNNCSSCHQATGAGLPGVFPPLKGNPAVLDDNPTDHIIAVLDGVSGKTIDGVDYASPMPGFGSILSDEEVAAVVNHERTSWGNNAKMVSAADIAMFRQK